MRTLAALTLVALGSLSGGCAETSLKVGLQTRSAIYANSLLEQEKGVRALLTANPPRVGILQGVSPGAPLRGLGPLASDAVRVALHRRCEGSTVVSGPTVVGLAARAGKSQELARVLRDANDTGILSAPDLAELGKATGLDYFFLGIVGANYVRDATRFSLLGLTAVRSNWTTSTLTLQLWHAPSGRMVWQSVGDCTEYTETVATAPVPLHIVTAEIASAMVNDLVQGRSRTTLIWVMNQPARSEPEHAESGAEAHPLPEPESGVDAYCPADKPELELEPVAGSR
ncbi:MAG: hypothetical protein FJ292_10275 [Planctomycetes bacterium]|nr:hypothetical protein [Planctomycetota bacterium]